MYAAIYINLVAIILWESAVINLTLIMVIILLLICEAVTGTYSVRESTDLLHLYMNVSECTHSGIFLQNELNRGKTSFLKI